MRRRAASAVICPARVRKNGLAVTSIASAGSWSSLANCASISSPVLASRTSNFCPSTAAASRASPRSVSSLCCLSRPRLASAAIVAALGTRSCRRPRRRQSKDAGHVTARSIYAGHEAHADRIAAIGHDDGNRRGVDLLHQFFDREGTGENDHANFALGQIGQLGGQEIISTVREAVFDSDITAFGIANITEATAE